MVLFQETANHVLIHIAYHVPCRRLIVKYAHLHMEPTLEHVQLVHLIVLLVIHLKVLHALPVLVDFICKAVRAILVFHSVFNVLTLLYVKFVIMDIMLILLDHVLLVHQIV